jgi:hypothetical protein
MAVDDGEIWHALSCGLPKCGGCYTFGTARDSRLLAFPLI